MPLLKNHTKEMVEAIKVEREQIANEIDRLMSKLEALDSTLAAYGVKKLRPRSKRTPVKSDAGSGDSMPASTLGDSVPSYVGLTQAQAAYRYLIEKGEPAHVNEITEAMLARGFILKGDSQKLNNEERKHTLKQSLVSVMVRDKRRFKNLGRNTFEIVETEHQGAQPLATFNPYDRSITPYSGYPRHIIPSGIKTQNLRSEGEDE